MGVPASCEALIGQSLVAWSGTIFAPAPCSFLMVRAPSDNLLPPCSDVECRSEQALGSRSGSRRPMSGLWDGGNSLPTYWTPPFPATPRPRYDRCCPPSVFKTCMALSSFRLLVLMNISPGSSVEKSHPWYAIRYYGFDETKAISASPPRVCSNTEPSGCNSCPSPQRPPERGSATIRNHNTATGACTTRDPTGFEKTAGLVSFDPPKHSQSRQLYLPG